MVSDGANNRGCESMAGSVSSYGKKHRDDRQGPMRAFVMALVICGALLFSQMVSYLVRGDRQSAGFVLSEKINPNTASLGSLVRLPNIGPKRAGAIIEYRESTGEQTKAFVRAEDLEKVHGVGPKTIERIKNLLCFE